MTIKKIPENVLHTLGLSAAQMAVYLAVLELGEANMLQIAKKSEVHRTTIYTFIDELIDRGFLKETQKKKRKVYTAVDPHQLLEMEKVRLAQLEGEVLPELLAIANNTKKKPRVTFYEGVSGIEQVYGDMLKDRKPILEFEDLDAIKDALSKSFYEYFPAERARRNITLQTISRRSSLGKEFVQKNIKHLRTTKFLNDIDWQTDISIYGNKVALMSFRSSIPYCVLIEDPYLAETLKSIWTELWERIDEPAIG